MKTIGIIGAGRVAKAFARQLGKTGINEIISNSRGPASLSAVVSDLGPRVKAATAYDAAQAEIVVLAVQWNQVHKALSGLPPWNGRILIDVTNPGIDFDPYVRAPDLGIKTSSEYIADLAPGARLVKAFNTIYYKKLENYAEHVHGKQVIFLSGDDLYAKRHCVKLIHQLGFAAVDLGKLSSGGKMCQPGGPLSQLNLIQLRS